MSDSVVSMIFLGVLGVLFVLLVVLTIVLIATRKKNNDEEYDEEDYQDYSDEEYDDSEEYSEGYEEDSEEYDDGYEEDSEEYAEEEYSEEADAEEEYAEEYAEDNANNNAGGNQYADNGVDAYEEETAVLTEAEETAEALDEDDPANNEKTIDISDVVNKVKAAKKAGIKSAPQPEAAPVPDATEAANISQPAETAGVAVAEQLDNYIDSAFAPYTPNEILSNEAIMASVKEAEEISEAVMYGKPDAEAIFGLSDQLDSYSKKKTVKKSTVSSNEDFYWYNKMDVAEKPSYKTKEMYYHYFNVPKDCIEDLLIEMYDCALVRTEEIRYIAYGIAPKAVSIKDILSEGNYYYSEQPKMKEPLPQDLIKIYEKWCGYVEKLLDKIEIHADEFTIQEIKRLLCEYGRNDVDVLIEGK
ncbi:MAG: hypothetical protein IJT72_08100 [Lachnospiraceae bacterium]|nr:hypothetical protein [Lachnospiraceae bacterium]